MWANRRHEAVIDLESLIRTLEALVIDPSIDEVRFRAQHTAHQLAGVFGVFGFSESKAMMARIDFELSDPAISVLILLDSAREILISLP
jgi:hypothetical protein